MPINAISFMNAPAKAPQAVNQQTAANTSSAPAENASQEAPKEKKGKGGKILALCVVAAGIAGIAYAAKKGKFKLGKASSTVVNDAEKVHARIVANNQKYLEKANDILARKGETLSSQTKKTLGEFMAKYQSRIS